MNAILLLHGALGTKSQFTELEKKLTGEFNFHSLNFSGHGGKPMPAAPFSIKMFAEDILHYIDAKRIERINIFGYSMGGYAAMYLARHYPARVEKIFTLATKFLWNEEISAHEIKMLNYEKIKEKIPSFASELEKRHAPLNPKILLNKTAEMMINLGRENELKAEDFPLIDHDVMVGIGDRDKMVTLEETVDVYKSLPNGKLTVLPNTPHPFEAAKTGMLADAIKSFML